MILAIFHAGGQTRDKKMETICKENTNTISFLKNVIKEPIKSPLSFVSLMFWSDVFALYTSFLSPPLIDISLVLFIVYLSKF